MLSQFSGLMWAYSFGEGDMRTGGQKRGSHTKKYEERQAGKAHWVRMRENKKEAKPPTNGGPYAHVFLSFSHKDGWMVGVVRDTTKSDDLTVIKIAAVGEEGCKQVWM